MDAACCECPLSWHNSDCLDCAGPAQAPLPSYIGTSAAQATFCLETIDREEFSDAYAGVDLHIYGQTVDFGKDSIVIPIALRIRTRPAKHNHDDGTAEISTMLISRQIWIHIQIHNHLSRVISMMTLILSKTVVMKMYRPSIRMM